MRGPVGLRALTSYGGTLALLVVAAAVLGAGTALAVGAAEAGGGRAATALPLAVLALVVVPVLATELARRRRPSTTLVRVRGASDVRLLAATGGPAVLAVVAGGLLGVAGAVGASGLMPGSGDVPVGTGGALAWAAGVVGASALLALACARLAAREPLAAALRRPVRARPTGPWGLVVLTVVLVAAAATVYLAAGAEGTDDGGVLVLAGAGVLGLAVGELVVRLLPVVAALAQERRTPEGLVGLRRAGDPGQAGRLRATVAAGVVAVAALSATSAAGAWAERSERVRLGAPLQLALPSTGAVEALLLTRRLDPDGRWLMAGAVTDDRTEPELRTGWLDLARWERVAGAHLAATPAAVGGAVDDLTSAPAVTVVTGEQVEVAGTATRATRVDLTHLDPDGFVATTSLDLGPAGRAEAPVDCAAGCVVLSVSAQAPVELTRLVLGDDDLLATGWARSDDLGTVSGPGTLALDRAVQVPAAAAAPTPVLTAGSPTWTDGPRVVAIDGGDRPAVDAGSQAALPLVGTAGLLADLPVALAGAGAQQPGVRTVVLARADTPGDLLAALTAAGAEAPQDGGGPADALGPRRAAERDGRLVVVPAAALLAGLALVAGSGRRVAADRRDRAALRLVGLGARPLRTAALVEAGALGALVTVAVGLGALVVSLLVSPGSGLVPAGTALLPLDSAVSVPVLVLGPLAVGVLTALTVLATRWGGVRRSAPATLLHDPEGAP